MALAILTLSLGIGANAVIFTLVNALLLRPLTFPQAERLVTIADHFRAEGRGTRSRLFPSGSICARAAARSRRFRFSTCATCRLPAATSRRAFSARVDGSFLTVLGAQPQRGRLFVPDDNTPGRDHVVVLTDDFWRRNFGADTADPTDAISASPYRSNPCTAHWRIVSPQYFSVLGIPLLDGRTFNDNDAGGRQPVAIVNVELARLFFPGQSAIGQQIRSGIGPRAATTTIVGVVGSVRPVWTHRCFRRSMCRICSRANRTSR